MVSQIVGISGTKGTTTTVDRILWYQTAVTVVKTGSAVIPVSNEYAGYPAFASDGFHLTPGSAAIDKGINEGVPADIDGYPRPNGVAPDLGASEFYLTPPSPTPTSTPSATATPTGGTPPAGTPTATPCPGCTATPVPSPVIYAPLATKAYSGGW